MIFCIFIKHPSDKIFTRVLKFLNGHWSVQTSSVANAPTPPFHSRSCLTLHLSLLSPCPTPPLPLPFPLSLLSPFPSLSPFSLSLPQSAQYLYFKGRIELMKGNINGVSYACAPHVHTVCHSICHERRYTDVESYLTCVLTCQHARQYSPWPTMYICSSYSNVSIELYWLRSLHDGVYQDC